MFGRYKALLKRVDALEAKTQEPELQALVDEFVKYNGRGNFRVSNETASIYGDRGFAFGSYTAAEFIVQKLNPAKARWATLHAKICDTSSEDSK